MATSFTPLTAANAKGMSTPEISSTKPRYLADSSMMRATMVLFPRPGDGVLAIGFHAPHPPMDLGALLAFHPLVGILRAIEIGRTYGPLTRHRSRALPRRLPCADGVRPNRRRARRFDGSCRALGRRLQAAFRIDEERRPR